MARCVSAHIVCCWWVGQHATRSVLSHLWFSHCDSVSRDKRQSGYPVGDADSARCRDWFCHRVSRRERVCFVSLTSKHARAVTVYPNRYDRYWMGRTCWSDLIRNSRTMSRLIWFHVPPRLTSKTPEEMMKGRTERSEEEMLKVMSEKYMALDLILGYTTSVTDTCFTEPTFLEKVLRSNETSSSR